MLKRSRLSFPKSPRRLLSTSFNASVRRLVASLAPLFLFLNDAAFADNASQRLTQPTQNNRLSLSIKTSQELASDLAQLKFQFQEAQKIGSERLDELTPQIDALLNEARRLATAPQTDARLAEEVQSFISQLEAFQQFIVVSADFFQRLAKLDAASLDEQATRLFFENFSSQRDFNFNATPYFNEVSNSADSPAAALAKYRAELNRAAASNDALQTLENWNAFVEARGAALERFYVAPDVAESGLAFIAQVNDRQGLPKEFKILERRAAEWRFTSLNRVAIQRKILLALEAETTVKYWTFAATPDKIYYLQQPPRPGRNVCFANSQGAFGAVDIPINAPEIASSEPTQRQFLQSLATEARSIPESLRVDDAARWYAAWSAFLSRLQTTDALDPLVQFRLLHSVAKSLASGDFYFAQRLEPTVRMLNLPQLADADALDVFQAENVDLPRLRSLARTRIAFLPTDRLTVDKTTAELDAQTERFSFVYRRVGWLDRDFSGAWRCRRPENAPLPVGDLYVLLLESDVATLNKSTDSDGSFVADRHNDKPSRSTPRFRWLKIGSSDGRQTTLKFAAPHVCRGSIVLCRSRVGSPKPVAERGELERIIRR